VGGLRYGLLEVSIKRGGKDFVWGGGGGGGGGFVGGVVFVWGGGWVGVGGWVGFVVCLGGGGGGLWGGGGVCWVFGGGFGGKKLGKKIDDRKFRKGRKGSSRGPTYYGALAIGGEKGNGIFLKAPSHPGIRLFSTFASERFP